LRYRGFEVFCFYFWRKTSLCKTLLVTTMKLMTKDI